MSTYTPTLVSLCHFFHFILTANWLLRGILEELASRLVARWFPDVRLSVPRLGYVLMYTPNSFDTTNASCKQTCLTLCQHQKSKESFAKEVNSLHIPSITSHNSLTSYVVVLCRQVVVPAASSSNTRSVVEAEGDNGENGCMAEFLEHQ